MFLGMHSHIPVGLNSLAPLSLASLAFKHTFGITVLKICALTSKAQSFGEISSIQDLSQETVVVKCCEASGCSAASWEEWEPGWGKDRAPFPTLQFKFVLQTRVPPLDFLMSWVFLITILRFQHQWQNWGLLPDDLFCEAPFSLLLTGLIPPVLSEDILEIYLQDPVIWGLNLYQYLIFSISELTLIDWFDFYPFLALIRHLFRPHNIKSVSWSCQSLWQIFMRFHVCDLSVLKWITWLLLLLSGCNLAARLGFSFCSNVRLW